MPSSWSRTKENEKLAQRLYAATKPKNLVPSRTFVNASQKEPYTGTNMQSARPEGNQHLNYFSAPVVAQIRRV